MLGRRAAARLRSRSCPAPPGALLTAFCSSLQAVIYTYDGWTGPVYFSEEMDDPGRNVPRALFGGVLAVDRDLPAVNVAFLYVLPISRDRRQPFAAGALAEAVFGPRMATRFLRALILSLLSAHQREPPDGEPHAVRHEPRRAVSRQAARGQRRRHAGRSRCCSAPRSRSCSSSSDARSAS